MMKLLGRLSRYGRILFLKTVSFLEATGNPHYFRRYVTLAFFTRTSPADSDVFFNGPILGAFVAEYAPFRWEKSGFFFFYSNGHPSTLSAKDLKLCSSPVVSGSRLCGYTVSIIRFISGKIKTSVL